MLFIKFMRFLNMLCRVYTYFAYTKTKSDKSWFEDMIEKLPIENFWGFGNDKITKFSQKPNYSTQRNIVQLMKAFSLTLLTYFIEYNSDTSSFKKPIGQFLWHFLEFELKISEHSSIYYIHCKGIDVLYCWRDENDRVRKVKWIWPSKKQLFPFFRKIKFLRPRSTKLHWVSSDLARIKASQLLWPMYIGLLLSILYFNRNLFQRVSVTLGWIENFLINAPVPIYDNLNWRKNDCSFSNQLFEINQNFQLWM